MDYDLDISGVNVGYSSFNGGTIGAFFKGYINFELIDSVLLIYGLNVQFNYDSL